MNKKDKELYNATAHIDEALIDGLVTPKTDPDKRREPAAQRKTRPTVKRKPIYAAIAAVLAAAFLIGAVGVFWHIRSVLETPGADPSPSKSNAPVFVSQPGNYTAARFICLADTSRTAQQVYANNYFDALQQYRQNAGKLDAFFDRLSEKLLDGKNNAVVSPVNVYLALSMLAECTGGTSRRQILDLIGVSSIEELREQSKSIWLYNSRDGENGRSLLGNSVWLSSDLPVKKDCADILKNDHYASAFAGDFADDDYKTALKQWLSDQTNGLLDDFINKIEISDGTAAAIASTLYYKASWLDKYTRTKRGVFKGTDGKQNCVFNVKTAEGTIYQSNGFTAFRDKLSDGNDMWFFLPDEGKSTEDLPKDNLVGFVNDDISGKGYDLTVMMPDFDVCFNRSVIEDLKTLGVTDCTDAMAADFSALTDDTLYLSDAIHAVRFKADKDGVEGAAYTEFAYYGGMDELPKYDFTLDRPFLFMVVNNGVPLFYGTVANL